MIQKVKESWGEVEQGVERAEHAVEPEDLEKLLGQIQGVRGVLKKMCQVSVTRTSLREAVREALLPLIEEHRDELFPEIVELRRRLAAADEDPSALDVFRGGAPAPAVPEEHLERLDQIEERMARLGEIENRIRSEVTSLDERVARDVSRLGHRVSEDVAKIDGRLSTELEQADAREQERDDELRQTLAGEFRSSVQGAEEKIEQVREDLARLERTVPEIANTAAGEAEARLRKEIASMLEQVTTRLDEVRDMLRRMEETAPRREVLESVHERLGRLEEVFEKVSGQVGEIESVTPEIRGLGEQFSGLRQQIAEAHQTLDRATGEARDGLLLRLEDLQRVLREGIGRWESDQSDSLESLTRIRDELRDQIGHLVEQVESAQGSLWGKLSGKGKKAPGLKLSGEDFEQLSEKLEGIIEGIGTVIARKGQRS